MRKRLLNVAARVAAFLGLAIARVLPLSVLRRIADVVGGIAYLLLGERRRMMLEHLAIAFGDDLSPRERRRIAIASLRNLARTSLEFLKLPALSPECIRQLVPLVGMDTLREQLAGNRGAIVITAHSGNWEYLAARLAAEGLPVNVLAREHDDAATAALINRIRRTAGVNVISKWDLRAALRCLRRGEILGILPDQNVAEGGILADFLGRPATTFTTPANFALRTNLPLIPAFGLRLPDGSLRAVVEEPLPLAQTGDREADILTNTRIMNDALSAAIRQHPEQWLWIHRRWKAAPSSPGPTSPEGIP